MNSEGTKREGALPSQFWKWGRSAPSPGKGAAFPFRVLHRKGTRTSTARNVTAAAVQLRPPAAHASGRRWLHRSHPAHTSGGGTLRRKAELAARPNGRKAPARA